MVFRFGRAVLFVSLLCGWILQLATSFSPDLICQFIPGLNAAQRAVCRRVPEAMVTLTRAEEEFATECQWQFRKDHWNCTNTNPPIFRDPHIQETREAAFVYAMTSAITVHQITQACSHGELPTCGCDTSKNGMRTVQGWEWGSCSDDVSYGVRFVQDFLDARELEMDHTDVEQVAKALVHLHNNAAGRRVVQDNMKLSCRCHGFSGSCAVKTCWRELPSLYEIGDKIREKYDSAVKVEAHIPRDGGPARLQYFSSEIRGHSFPSNNDLVFLQLSPSYCSIHQNYTLGRYCVPRANLTEELQGYYSPCEDLCCSREYYTRHHTVTYSCNCTFRWCCEVMCQTCVEDITEYLCTG